jgi:phosphoribosylglycinamide formyltransferase-1
MKHRIFMKRMAIFASGSGTNAENIIRYFQDREDVEVAVVLSNRKDAYVLQRAERYDIPAMVFDRRQFYESSDVLDRLVLDRIDLIVLAGFLWLVPAPILKEFSNRIINIHPALLPKYGGKGMYGSRVHEAVKESGDPETGISIHYVNERYDEGEMIFQARCKVLPGDSPDDIARKVHALEYEHFPRVIDELLD